VPDSLSSSQCLGALRRFWCFLAIHQAQVSIVLAVLHELVSKLSRPSSSQDCKSSSAIAPKRSVPGEIKQASASTMLRGF
jgi:hypothetical protein